MSRIPTYACDGCAGCGLVADDETLTPWTEWKPVCSAEMALVLFGEPLPEMRPLACPHCHGTGRVSDYDDD